MKRLRLAPLVALAGLGLLSGCRTCHDPCNGNGGFFSRLAARRNGVITTGPVIGTPVSSMPCGDPCCDGGPLLGDPTVMNGGPIYPPFTEMPATGMPFTGVPPVTTMPPATMVPPATTLPAPVPSTAPPPLAPVPTQPAPGNGLATPTPAQPSARWRR